MEHIRLIIRKLLEGMSVGDGGSLSSDDDPDVLSDTTIELVNDYIRNNQLFASSRYGKAQDYYLPLEAKEYFDHIGFKKYDVIEARRTNRSPWKKVVRVEFWYLPPAEMQENMDATFDAEEVSNFVDEYIRRHKIDAVAGAGPFRDYYLPLDAKEIFDEVGFTRYKLVRADNPQHEDYGKTFVVVPSWTKVD